MPPSTGSFRVFDIADFIQITPADLQTHACVIVGTMQTLRVKNTDGRKVYAHNENLEPHFSSRPRRQPRGWSGSRTATAKGRSSFHSATCWPCTGLW